ncbi:MAG: valine--tRNA ligase [Pyrinomonadaceae bacterium]
MDIPKQYDPKQAEQEHYERWEKQGCFAPEINRDPDAPAFSIVIPPPNVTGSLHMGHALQHTMMDVLTRYKRMCGYRTLWLPGMDHAGISTQLMVTRELKKEGLTRHDLGREKFVERVWKWKKDSGGQITKQMRREGASVDWSREKFTMDDDLSRAVREAFVRLYEEGMIYRGNRIVNWCPNDQTVLSDLEVQKDPQAGKLYYLRYPEKNGERSVTVATTRPETMLGDTAVAVNPNDDRYRALLGTTLMLPLTGREVPVVADEFVDPEFGTGAVKVTPAHDPNDYDMGVRHNLAQIVVIDPHARMTEAAGAEFAGLDRYKARAKVVEKFEELGLLEKVVDYEFSISKCERCKTVIEPLISTQWFLRMDELRDGAVMLLETQKKPKFVPEVPYEKIYANWLENLRDWTISRQLWWGHQIPAWYTPDGEIIVARSEEAAREKAGTAELTQDPDVLDTWFSSALWPFSTFGWPDEAADLKTFYPTSVLVTARDIIFLWVSRMVMTGMKFMGDRPFDDVFVTGTILDKHGQRMSKTKMNGIDPLEVFDKYGVDATRLTLASVGTTDTRWNEKQVESYRNFANKIWNAARFCLMNSESAEVGRGFEGDPKTWLLHDRWIMFRLQMAMRQIADALDKYEFHSAVQIIYHFFWDDFCDWYIELSKADITAVEPSRSRDASRSRALTVLEQALRLLHPFMPFITEELWQLLPGIGVHLLHPAYKDSAPTIMLARFPQAPTEPLDDEAEAVSGALMEIISRIRMIRAELNIKPGQQIKVFLRKFEDEFRQTGSEAPPSESLLRAQEELVASTLTPDAVELVQAFSKLNLITMEEAMRKAIESSQSQIMRLTRASEICTDSKTVLPRSSVRAVLAGGYEIAIPLEGVVDFEQERQRLRKELDKLDTEAAKVTAQLDNQQFVERAPVEKVGELRERSTEIYRRTVALRQMLEALG